MLNAIADRQASGLAESLPDTPPPGLSKGQKAAVIVRVLLANDVPIPLERLAARQQERLARRMTELRSLDKQVLTDVVEEFTAALDGTALTFPRGLADALDMLEPYMSPGAVEELNSSADVLNRTDAWDRLNSLELPDLMHLVEEETADVCAILLSKLPVAKASQMLAEMPVERSEEIVLSVARTGIVGPHTVNRIGKALVTQLDAKPAPAFRTNAADRVGLILDAAPGKLRDALLSGLENRNADFAEEVRRTIFTFDLIPSRLDAGDVPALVRSVDNEVLSVALAGALRVAPLSADFIFDNISKRMAEGLREEAMALGEVPEDEADQAMSSVIGALRGLEASGEIKLKVEAAAE